MYYRHIIVIVREQWKGNGNGYGIRMNPNLDWKLIDGYLWKWIMDGHCHWPMDIISFIPVPHFWGSHPNPRDQIQNSAK